MCVRPFVVGILAITMIVGTQAPSIAQNGNPFVNPGQESAGSGAPRNPGNAGAPRLDQGSLPVIYPVVIPNPQNTTAGSARVVPVPRAPRPIPERARD